MANYATLQKNHQGPTAADPWPDGVFVLPRGPWRFPEYVETPRFVFDRKPGRAPVDLESIGDIWIVSKAMKSVLESVDPEACEFRPCESLMRSGEPGPETWLCSIVRAFVGAVDADKSVYLNKYTNSAGQIWYGMNPGTQLALRPEVVGSAHLFHIAELGTTVFCDQSFRDACRAAKLNAVMFTNVSKK